MRFCPPGGMEQCGRLCPTGTVMTPLWTAVWGQLEVRDSVDTTPQRQGWEHPCSERCPSMNPSQASTVLWWEGFRGFCIN